MGKFLRILLAGIILAIVGFTGASALNHTSHSNKTIKGNGNLYTQTRHFTDFDSITANGSFTIDLKKGKKQLVTVSADKNILPYVETKIDNNLLTISLKNGVNITTPHRITIDITLKDLENLSLAGNSIVLGQGIFSRILNVNMHGASQVDLGGKIHLQRLILSGSGMATIRGVDSHDLTVRTSGSSQVIVSGKAYKTVLDIFGSSGIDASQLTSHDAWATIAGLGVIKVNASHKLLAKIAGMGDIFYSGSPEVTKEINGAGSVTHING